MCKGARAEGNLVCECSSNKKRQEESLGGRQLSGHPRSQSPFLNGDDGMIDNPRTRTHSVHKTRMKSR